jgi:kynurenine formamidase
VEQITAADLEANSPLPEPGEIVFVHTGWGRHFQGDHALYHRHPYLSADAADWLVERRVKMLAMDIATPDLPEGSRPPGFDWPVHHTLLGNGVLVAEHLANLDQVVGRRFRAYLLPLRIQGSDGSPVRAVGEL